MSTQNIKNPGSGASLTLSMLFRQVWMASNKRSLVTGLFLRGYLNTELWPNCFAHVLAKGQNRYPYFRFYAKNIALLTPGEHALYDNGTEEARINYSLDVEERTGGKSTADWQKLYDLRDELLKEYDKYFPRTKGMLIGYKYSPEEQIAIVSTLNQKYFESIIKEKASRNDLLRGRIG